MTFDSGFHPVSSVRRRLPPADRAARPARAIALPQPAPVLKWTVAALVALTLLTVLLARPAFARGTPEGFADLAERLSPAVVNISTAQTLNERNSDMMPQFPPGTPFDEFFKEFFDRQQGGGGQGGGQGGKPPAGKGGKGGGQRATSLGSGFIIDPDGLIVTNNHVIQDAEEITVILSDDTALKAQVVGRDAKVDVALLKVNSKTKLPFVPFGNSDSARVGDWVMAIGNPFGLGGTVTAGIISAKTRDINAGPYDSFIQTDASINRGNSGGPLFNMDGEVIGINTAIYSPSGGSVGIGFATPSNLAKQVLGDLKKFGKTRRGWLGVRIQSVNDDIAESLGLKRAYGALVSGVQADSPAGKAGVVAGDVILDFNGHEVKDMRRLPMMVAEAEIGAQIPMTLWRDGAQKSVKVVIGELKEEEEEQAAQAPVEKVTPEDRGKPVTVLGFSAAPLTDSNRARYELPGDARGVVITDVARDGIAADKGLRVGDVIPEVNQAAVTTADEISAQVAKARGLSRKSVLLQVQNASGMRFVAMPITSTPEPEPTPPTAGQPRR